MIAVGLIGFGLAGRYFHAPVIRAVPELRLAAILQRTGNEAAEQYPDVRIVRSLDELLEMKQVQLIVIATPNDSHFPLAKRCLEAGRDVVVDKPFTLTMQEANELVEFAQEKKRLLTVYQNRRWDGDFGAVREVVASGVLGRIVHFAENYDRFRPQLKQNAWRERAAPGSGILFDLAPHLIDHALVLFGTPQSISADVRAERDGAVADDAFEIVLHYANGVRAALGCSMLGAMPRARFLLHGTRGAYLKSEFDPLEPALRRGDVPQAESWDLERPENFGVLTLTDGKESALKRVPPIGDWRGYYANVRDVLLGRAAPAVPSQQMLDVMLGLELARKSSKLGKTLPWHVSAAG
jgi:scyllo-inositol 2-dehydrogenase (NADP+)